MTAPWAEIDRWCKDNGRPFRWYCDSVGIDYESARWARRKARAEAELETWSAAGEIPVTKCRSDGKQDRQSVTLDQISGLDPTGKQRSLVKFALIGDTHFGSKHCCVPELADFYRHAYGLGVRRFYHTGDIVAGYHAKWRNELLANGIDDQVAIALECLPRLDGAETHFITGNHCDKYQRLAGLEVGQHVERIFREHGRTDVRFIGGNRSTTSCDGVNIALQHPTGGGAVNLSSSLYGYLQRHPNFGHLGVYACGHYHRTDYAWRAGVHCFATPCFEGSSIWGQGLRGNPDVGGLVVELDGKDFRLHRRLY